MTQERRAESLQQFGRDIDPFQSNILSEKARIIGLKNLYAQMVDPSLEHVKAVATSLVNLPPDHLRQLRYETLDVSDNPGNYYTRHGISVPKPTLLLPGIGNAGILLGRISDEQDYRAEGIQPEGEINLSEITGLAYEYMQVLKGQRHLGKATEVVHSELDLEARCELAVALRDQTLSYINAFPFSFWGGIDGNRAVDPTWENLVDTSQLAVRFTQKDRYSFGDFGIKDAIKIANAAMKRYDIEKGIEKIAPRSKERFNELRSQFGAKAANLIMLSEMTGEINDLREPSLNRLTLAIPDFKAIPVDVYRAWKEGKLIDDVARPYFEWASQLKDDRWSDGQEVSADYIVRSSAIFSEDGETTTGAGIYDSVGVSSSATFDEFKAAVIRVFESTDSPEAQAYRAQYGIDKEEMGLVIQKYVSPKTEPGYGQSQRGYINSKLVGVSELMEIVTGTSRNFINRDELDFYLGEEANRNQEVFQSLHHFPPDQKRTVPMMLVRAAQITHVIERLWGGDIQIEFVADRSTINVVQVRNLPENLQSQIQKIEFPEGTPAYWGSSIGVGDKELTVLDNRNNNSQKTGAVIFTTNHAWTGQDNTNRLPKEGAVIIYSSGGESGHIQTLCAEKGLICLFSNGNEDDKSGPKSDNLARLKRVRIVSNGIEAKVYPGQEASKVGIQEPFAVSTDQPNELADLCSRLVNDLDDVRIKLEVSGQSNYALADSFYDVAYFVDRAGQYYREVGGSFSGFISELSRDEVINLYNNLVNILNLHGHEDFSAGREFAHIDDNSIEDPLFSMYELVKQEVDQMS